MDNDDDDELERALWEPRLEHKTGFLIPGTQRVVSYTRQIAYPAEERDYNPAQHALPIGRARDDEEGPLGVSLPDPYAETWRVDIDETPESRAEFEAFVAEDLPRLVQPRVGTSAAECRQRAKHAAAALRRQMDGAASRARVDCADMLSLDWAGIVPPVHRAIFAADAAPVLAVLLPMLHACRGEMLHETVPSLVETLAAAGCTHLGTEEITLAGPLKQFMHPQDAADDDVNRDHQHMINDGGTWQSPLLHMHFACALPGDDDSDNDDDNNNGKGPVPSERDVTSAQGVRRIVVPHGDAHDAEHARHVEKDTGVAPHRYRVHIVAHRVLPQPRGVPAAVPVACFRSFYFTRAPASVTRPEPG